MIRKLLIIPWFGDLPLWIEHWRANVWTALAPCGYDILLTGDLTDFRQRCSRILGVDCPIVPGEAKIHDYRCAFGLLYADELRGYDFWGHTDLDMVYGRVERWVTDEFLEPLDIHSNHVDYIAGPWTLYRNRPLVNELFMRYERWREVLEHPDVTGWVEKQFTVGVDLAAADGELTRRYTMWQTANLNSFDTLRLEEDGRLMEGRTEVAMAHFRRLVPKVYPAGCGR